MDRYFAYHVIFIVSLGGCTICAPEWDLLPGLDFSDDDHDHCHLVSAQNVNGKNLGQIYVEFSSINRGLVFHENNKAVGPVPSDSPLLIRYSTIRDVDLKDDRLIVSRCSSDVILTFRNEECAKLFFVEIRRLRE